MIKKIDAHVHTRRLRCPARYGDEFEGKTFALPEELLDIYKVLNVDKALILPVVNPECSYGPQSNEEVKEIVERSNGLFAWCCNIDPRMGGNCSEFNISYFLDLYKSQGARGVGEICANLHFDDPLVLNLFHHCELSCMPVIFHISTGIGGCYGLVDNPGLPGLEKVLKMFPKLTFVGHSQPFWAEISEGIISANRNTYPEGKIVPGRVVKLMRRHQNLWADLSARSGFNALARDYEFGCSFIEEFKDRLLFGTDICFPEYDARLGLSSWLQAALEKGNISCDAYEKVCRRNAECLFNL